MNTLLEVNIKDIDVKFDHEYIYIAISQDLITAKISINDLKSVVSKLLKLLQTK